VKNVHKGKESGPNREENRRSDALEPVSEKNSETWLNPHQDLDTRKAGEGERKQRLNKGALSQLPLKTLVNKRFSPLAREG